MDKLTRSDAGYSLARTERWDQLASKLRESAFFVAIDACPNKLAMNIGATVNFR